MYSDCKKHKLEDFLTNKTKWIGQKIGLVFLLVPIKILGNERKNIIMSTRASEQQIHHMILHNSNQKLSHREQKSYNINVAVAAAPPTPPNAEEVKYIQMQKNTLQNLTHNFLLSTFFVVVVEKKLMSA